jgi:hypothetical protein
MGAELFRKENACHMYLNNIFHEHVKELENDIALKILSHEISLMAKNEYNMASFYHVLSLNFFNYLALSYLFEAVSNATPPITLFQNRVTSRFCR